MIARRLWPLLTAFSSAAMLAAAHAFQRFGGLQPCPLCLDQRNWHWAVVALSLAGLALARWKPAFMRWIIFAIGLVLLGSAAQAAFHVAVEQHWVVYRCEAGGDFGNLSFDVNAPLEVPQCDKVLWSLFGISMAGYNAIVSLLLALASFAVAFAPARRP
jgi:disulfide bond formation protein DsbB